MTSHEPFIIEVPESEEPYTDSTLTTVEESRHGGWNCTMADGWSITIPSLPIESYGTTLRPAITPYVGDRIRLYGKGIGYPFQGIHINDDVVFYRTEEQREAYRRRMLEDIDAQNSREFTLRKPELDKQYDELPIIFKQRIERFRRETPDFRKNAEAYELFCLIEAVKIAAACGTVEMIHKFKEQSYEWQREYMPDLGEGHSGYTFTAACVLAVTLIRSRAGEEISC